MNKSTRILTFSALLVALTVVLLYIASILPTAKIGITAIAGLMTAAAVIEGGLLTGFVCFIASSILAFILLPLKDIAALYIVFFGCYPVIKSLIEKTEGRVLEWTLKILTFNAALTVLYLLWYYGFLKGVDFSAATVILIYAAGNLCFVLYDIAFTRLVQFYLKRIHRKR